MSKKAQDNSWEYEADLVVIGFGGAGAATAITAADLGASVILLEKAPFGEEGGNTRVSAQGYWNPSCPQSAKMYLKALSGPHVLPEDIVDAWALEMCENNAWLRRIGGDPQEHQHPPVGIEYPELPGADSVRKYHHGDILGYSKTWEFLARSVRKRPIDVHYETPAHRLVQDPVSKAVVGVEARRAGEAIRFKASKAVVLTCGGFENNQEMIRNYLPGVLVCHTSGSPYNEGDGVRMGIEAGADLWHMNNFAGPSMALKVPEYPTTFSMRALHFSQLVSGAMIVVGPDAKRFTNEKYKLRHGKVKKSGVWATFVPPCPMYMIFDQAMLDAGPLYDGKPTHGWTQIMSGYRWSDNNRAELEKGWIKSAPSLPELASKLKLCGRHLMDTIRRWNDMCLHGEDAEFGRELMLTAFGAGPYYAVELSPSMLNTQGGPRRNACAQVVRPDGTPIPRLYSAGELGSIYAYLYQGTGNVGECFAFGRIAARNAVRESRQ